MTGMFKDGTIIFEVIDAPAAQISSGSMEGLCSDNDRCRVVGLGVQLGVSCM